MEKIPLPEPAVRLNQAWIATVEQALLGQDPDLARRVLRETGAMCARQILEDCAQILGRPPMNVDELLEATNTRRRQRHGVTSLWERRGNTARLALPGCNCTLVKAGLARPNPVHCLCSLGLMEHLFQAVCPGPVKVEMLQAAGRGDPGCEFLVSFEE